MTDRLARLGLRTAALAAFVAAVGAVLPCGAGTALRLKVSSGAEYETVRVQPNVTEAPAGSSLTLVVTDPVKGVQTESVSVQTVVQEFENRSRAQPLAIDGYVVSDGGAVTNAAAHGLLTMGRVHDTDVAAGGDATPNWNDHWLCESALTYTNGTGKAWTGKDYIAVSNGSLAIDTTFSCASTACVSCAIGKTPEPYRGYAIDAVVKVARANVELPDPEGQRLGLTSGFVDEENPERANFLYVANGEWTVVPVEVCDPLVSTNWQLHVSVDCSQGLATYLVRPTSNDAWTVLGTANGVGSAAVSVMSCQGKGFVDAVEGHGFDAQLVEVAVDFDPATLYPGVDFEATVVTGRVSASVLHATSKTNGTFWVRLRDLDGNTVESEYAFTAEGVMEFYVRASDLTAGGTYIAEVELGDDTAEANVSSVSQISSLARALTNEIWGTSGLWIEENARTFDGLEPGTGVWTTNDASSVYAWTADDWIQIRTISDEIDYPGDAKVTFEPTNEVDEAVTDYVNGMRVSFPGATGEPTDVDGVYGLTVVSRDGLLSFLCLSNRTWQIVPQDVAVPTLGTEYELTVSVHKDRRRLYYVVMEPGGLRTVLMAVDLLDSLCEGEVRSIDVSGIGQITDLTGCLYSSHLVKTDVEFAPGTLDPGTNFTQSVANGTVSFTKLWETTRTNGTIVIVLRNKYGQIVGRRSIGFADIGKKFDFEYLITKGLEPGESYTVSVETEVTGATASGDADCGEGFMARIVTNEAWRTAGWIREDADTFTRATTGTGGAVGSGTWDIGAGYASVSNGLIAIDTTKGSGRVVFTATNELPVHTGCEYRSCVFFDTDFSVSFEDADGVAAYGIRLVADTATAGHFEVLVNDTWTAVDTDLYEPEAMAEYEVTLRVDYAQSKAVYIVQGDEDPRAVVLQEFALADLRQQTPDRTVFTGRGCVRTHEGDGFDVTVIEMSTELDGETLTPGTNFASTVASGRLNIRQIWMTDQTSGDCTVNVIDAHGKVVSSQTVRYEALTNTDFTVTLEGLEAGSVYDVEIVAENGGEAVARRQVSFVGGRLLEEGWVREDPETFLGEKLGTGLWAQTNRTAWVAETPSGPAICIDSGDTPVLFSPTNDTPLARNSTVRELLFDLNFNDIGWLAREEDAPTPPEDAFAGVTIWSGAEEDEISSENCAIAVLTAGRNWLVLTNDTCDTRGLVATNARCAVRVLVDYKNGYVRYRVETDSATNVIHRYEFEPFNPERTDLAFAGSGCVWTLRGDVWDPNLIGAGTNEYADLNAAISGTVGESVTLFPLWWADQLVTVGRGEFRVSDPDHWLRVSFPDWYYVVIEEDGGVRVYRFNQSNNWIDYAAGGETNVTVTGTGAGSVYLVKTPEGLSWIAAKATNEWISGRIRLATNINLTAHNWTPIAGFSGTFDGGGWRIDGLNNTNRHDVPGGTYLYGPTNDWGRSTYGLFGTATNATLTGVTFGGVAISNLADSVAALAGVLAGNCAVSNVTVESGSVLGVGGTVAGLAGLADFSGFLTFVNNANAADITADSDLYGEGRYAAGLLCVGGPTDPSAADGVVTVTNNANYGLVANTIYDADLFGGNVAEILAGTTYGARYGDVRLTNNLAAGAVDAFFVRSHDNAIVQTNFPAVNLASAFWGYGEDGMFYRFLDANGDGAVPVDPVRHTARMLGGTFPNGTENAVGLLNDEISASLPGATVTVKEGFDSWGTINLDRDLTFDLGGNMIYTLYVSNTFTVASGVEATVRNGEIVVGYGETEADVVQAFGGDLEHATLHTNDNLTVSRVDETFYERTTVSVNGEKIAAFTSTYLSDAINRSDSLIVLCDEASVEIDVDNGALKVDGNVLAKLSDGYAFKTVTGEGGLTTYRVTIADSAAPTVSDAVDLGGGSDSEVSVSVGNAKVGFWYALQYKENMAQEWITPPANEWVQATAEGVSVVAPKEGDSGFYRVIMSDTPGGN